MRTIRLRRLALLAALCAFAAHGAEPAPVVVRGAVHAPGTYLPRPGETLSQMLARAGGYTGEAYPFGVVLQRPENAVARADASQLATLRVVVQADRAVVAARPDRDTRLEPGDKLYVPRRPDFVTVAGAVRNPGVSGFVPGAPAEAYLERAGGAAADADYERIVLVLPNGAVEPLRLSSWNYERREVPPGSLIAVAPRWKDAPAERRQALYRQFEERMRDQATRALLERVP